MERKAALATIGFGVQVVALRGFRSALSRPKERQRISAKYANQKRPAKTIIIKSKGTRAFQEGKKWRTKKTINAAMATAERNAVNGFFPIQKRTTPATRLMTVRLSLLVHCCESGHRLKYAPILPPCKG